MARKPKVITNTVRSVVWEAWSGRDHTGVWPLWIDDIVSGVARVDWYGDRCNQLPLSTVNILKCLTNLSEITTISVMDLMGYKESQAKLYVRACALCIQQIERCKDNKYYTKMKYPHVSIVSVEHGLSLRYDK